MSDQLQTQSAIMAFLHELCADDAARARLTPNTELMESGVLDSFGIVRLIGFLEEKFGLHIPDQDIGPELFSSASQLAAYVDRSRAAA
jgi:acyl carrier protein